MCGLTINYDTIGDHGQSDSYFRRRTFPLPTASTLVTQTITDCFLFVESCCLNLLSILQRIAERNAYKNVPPPLESGNDRDVLRPIGGGDGEREQSPLAEVPEGNQPSPPAPALQQSKEGEEEDEEEEEEGDGEGPTAALLPGHFST
uniref:E3 ubiquitin-protein ligase MARCH6 n=1 Tax=Lygus hesperus TaxID=30085 RepID=A0A0A9XD22_LYGHE